MQSEMQYKLYNYTAEAVGPELRDTIVLSVFYMMQIRNNFLRCENIYFNKWNNSLLNLAKMFTFCKKDYNTDYFFR